MTRQRTYGAPLRAQEGFTMVVIAALFIAFTTVAAVLVERNTATQLITRRDATMRQLQRLNNALIEYSVFHADGATLLYPCPAATNILTTSSAFGVSMNDGAPTPVDNCYNASAAVLNAAGIANPGGAGTDVLVGMVPVQALTPYGISLNDAFDPWNNRIMYVVNKQLTTGGNKSTGSNPTLFNYTSIAGSLYNMGPVIAKPDFILVSLGRDGVGAVRRGATTVGISCTVGSTLPVLNCTHMMTVSPVTTYYASPTYTGSTATNTSYSDDILSYHNQ